MQVSKKLTAKSNITIPKRMMQELGYQPGMAIDMHSTATGEVVIRPHVPMCRFCGRQEEVVHVGDVDICRNCAAELLERAGCHE